jgi:long-chain fatty acid transport protein
VGKVGKPQVILKSGNDWQKYSYLIHELGKMPQRPYIARQGCGEYFIKGVKMNIIVKSVFFLLAFLLFFGTTTFADEYHYNNILIGDRASGMGGAYTAISDDASGMFYNPAGIVYVTDRNFSASVNAYSSQTKTYDNVIGGQPFVRKSSGLLANYFGIIKPIGNFKFGFSYAVPDAVNEDLSLTVLNVQATTPYDYTINLNNRDNTYNFGPSLARAINNDLSVGLTLYVHQRNVLIIQNTFTARSTGTNNWSNSYFTVNETGIKPILGVSWAPIEKLSLGATLSTVYLLSSNSLLQKSCVDTLSPNCKAEDSSTPVTFLAPTFFSFDQKRVYPIRTSFGAAYFASSNLLLSGDITYHTAVVDPVFGDKVATLNAAVGTEYYLNKKLALRAGLFSNVANTQPIQAGVTFIEERINLYGASMSITSFTGDSSVTLGGSVSYGVGQSQLVSKDAVENATTFGWTMFLSSSY